MSVVNVRMHKHARLGESGGSLDPRGLARSPLGKLNSECDREVIWKVKNFLQLYRHAVQMSIGRQLAALVSIPLRALVLLGS